MENFGTGFALGLGTMSRAIEGGNQLKIMQDENAQRQKLYGREQEDFDFTQGLHGIQGKVLSGEIDPDTLQPRARPAPAASADGLAPQPTPWKDVRTPEQKQLDVLRATERYAESKGRGHTALQAFQMSIPLKEQLREKDFSQSWVNFKTTGNVQPLMDYANRYVADGIRFEGATPIAGADGKITGYKISATQNGQTLPMQDIPVDQVEGLFRAYAAPQNAWAADLERVKQLREIAHEAAKAGAKVRGENGGMIPLDPAKAYVDPKSGKVTPGVKYEVVPGPEGTGSSVVALPLGPGQASGQVVSGAAGKPSAGLTKPERDIETKALDTIGKAFTMQIDQMTMPEQRAKLSEQMQRAQGVVSDLILANREATSAGNISEGALAEIATGIATGKVKVGKAKISVDGKEVGEVDAVRLPNGTLMYTNPSQVQALRARSAQRDAANASAPKGDPAKEPNIRSRELPPEAKRAQDNMNSPQTKATRVQLLEDELTAERAKPASPQRDASIAGLEKEIEAITKSPRPGLQPVPAAPSAAPAPAPAPAAGLTPVAPEDFRARQATALRRQEAIKADPEVQALNRKRADALRAGKAAQANDFLAQVNALIEKRYPAFGTSVAAR